MACHPRVKGEGKKAHRLNTEIVFLPQNSCKCVRRLAAERNRDAAEHRVIWNSIPPDPVCTIQEKTNPAQKQRTGARKEITAKEDLMHSDSRVTLVAWQQYWLG